MDGCSVRHFYRDRSVLITGGTGFLGKVLVEKLLRSCPEIRRIFLLVRPRNETESVRQRLDTLIQSQVFDIVRLADPAALNKLVAINGDISTDGLGLTNEDQRQLQDEVSIVFHSAARVRFDHDIQSPTETNVKGTRRLIQFSRQLPHLQVVVHVSTCYVHPDRSVLDEEIYPPPVDPQLLIDCVEHWDQPNHKDLMQKITDVTSPVNTYGFTKAVTESLLQQEGAALPLVIVRPSIVTAAAREPMPGWTDTINGPTGIIAAVSKGFLRCARHDPAALINMIPVDLAVNCIIVAAWHTAVNKPDKIPVYNCTNGHLNPLTWTELGRLAYPHALHFPIRNLLWYPDYVITTDPHVHRIYSLIYHLIPGYFVDAFLYLSGQRPKMVRMYRKAHRAMEILEFYATRQWDVRSDNVLGLIDSMSDEDRRIFDLDVRRIDWPSYMQIYVLGVRRFIHKEDLSNLAAARRNQTRLYLIRTGLRCVLVSLVIYLLRLVSKLNLKVLLAAAIRTKTNL